MAPKGCNKANQKGPDIHSEPCINPRHADKTFTCKLSNQPDCMKQNQTKGSPPGTSSKTDLKFHRLRQAYFEKQTTRARALKHFWKPAADPEWAAPPAPRDSSPTSPERYPSQHATGKHKSEHTSDNNSAATSQTAEILKVLKAFLHVTSQGRPARHPMSQRKTQARHPEHCSSASDHRAHCRITKSREPNWQVTEVTRTPAASHEGTASAPNGEVNLLPCTFQLTKDFDAAVFVFLCLQPTRGQLLSTASLPGPTSGSIWSTATQAELNGLPRRCCQYLVKHRPVQQQNELKSHSQKPSQLCLNCTPVALHCTTASPVVQSWTAADSALGTSTVINHTLTLDIHAAPEARKCKPPQPPLDPQEEGTTLETASNLSKLSPYLSLAAACHLPPDPHDSPAIRPLQWCRSMKSHKDFT
ncbi:hypothetical protein F2P79_022616 [Pimephales promelas]|nr:hypothetical protein F2P79_022616 [Pimephales promelas]